MPTRPIILCIGGHDPSGGAGIQADIETVTALGGRALSIITTLTEQDSADVHALTPLDPALVARHLATLLADIRPHMVKIGLIGAAELVPIIADCVRLHRLPMVLDPVLAAGGGRELAAPALLAAIRTQLLPLTTLITPNRAEARRLSGQTQPDQAAQALLAAGCAAVLITGADEASGDRVSNHLYRTHAAPMHHTWPRLPHSYHGSGCTLAAACATTLAQGMDMAGAVYAAQAFTWQCLEHAECPGHGQHLPLRSPLP